MEFLKETLGEELYTQVSEKLKGSKIKLADLSGGAYVGKEKFDTTVADLKNQLTAANEAVTAANAEIESYKGMDIEGIKKAAAEWEQKATQFKADAEKAQQEAADKIAAMEYDNAINSYITPLKFSSEYAKRGFVEDFKAKGFKLEDGKFLGADDYVKSVREKDPGTFAPEEKADEYQFKGWTPAEGSNKTPSGQTDEFNFNFTPIKPIPKKE